MSGSRASEPGEWVLLCYRLPREPSTPRITLWRQLKRVGVVQLGDGLVALPADARTREQLEWAGQGALEAGGTAAVWLARPTTAAQERAMAQEMAAARADEYVVLAANAEHARALPVSDRVRILRGLRRQWREVTRRDFFPPPQRQAAADALRTLAESQERRATPSFSAPRSRSAPTGVTLNSVQGP